MCLHLLVLFCEFFVFVWCAKTLGKESIKTVSYEESIFWMKFTTFLFFLIGMIWIVQKFVSEKIAILTFLASVESLIVSALIIATIMYLSIGKKIERNCKCHI